MTKLSSILTILLSACVTNGQPQSLGTNSQNEDPYIPKLRVVETNDFIGKLGFAYHFTDEQLAQMARTKLEINRFVAYLERRWPIERLRAYCVATNVFPVGYQNLVPVTCPVETDLYKGKVDGFGRVWVYVSEDDGPGTYFEEAGTKWHRWSYSLNIERGNNHWVIIEDLPNDFMDSDKYKVIEQTDVSNESQTVRTNRTPSPVSLPH